MKRTVILLALAALAACAPAQKRGNVIFFHPDGTGLNTWNAARMYWAGPDGTLNWDRLEHMAAYRGHMLDVLVGTSNGGATTHAFGYKVAGPGSYGQDGPRSIRSLSGYPGSLMREAGAAGMPIGIVNDGNVGEPGTGAFLAEVANRGDWNAIAAQILNGRPGLNDSAPAVILGGGERNFLPTGVRGIHGEGQRTDGLNLIEVARSRGYEVLRTRAEFETFRDRLQRERDWTPKVLGLFAHHHTYNDTFEEDLIAKGMVLPTAHSKTGRLLLYGTMPGTAGHNPPTVGEMAAVALEVLDRHARKAKRSFFLVVEPESTDNFGNEENAIGVLTAVKRADEAVGAMLDFHRRRPNTLIVTAADSDADGLQVNAQPPGPAESLDVNPSGEGKTVKVPTDGIDGPGTTAFVAEPDQFGKRLSFGIAWAGSSDMGGGILSRAHGLNAEFLRTRFGTRFDNVDVYRLMHATLFGRLLPYPQGQTAPSRP